MTQDEIDLMRALPRIAELEKDVASLKEVIESLKGNHGAKDALSTAEALEAPPKIGGGGNLDAHIVVDPPFSFEKGQDSGAPVDPSAHNIKPPVGDELVPEPPVEEPVSDPSSGAELAAAE